jgi:hypothetical protein
MGRGWVHTVAGVDLGLRSRGLADHDGNAGVVLLHDGVRAVQKCPNPTREGGKSQLSVALPPSKPLARFSRRGGKINVPYSGAVLRRLAEQEAHLLEGLGESVSGRHVCAARVCERRRRRVFASRIRGSIGGHNGSLSSFLLNGESFPWTSDGPASPMAAPYVIACFACIKPRLCIKRRLMHGSRFRTTTIHPPGKSGPPSAP